MDRKLLIPKRMSKLLNFNSIEMQSTTRPSVLRGQMTLKTPRAQHMRSRKPNINASTRRSLVGNYRNLANFVPNVSRRKGRPSVPISPNTVKNKLMYVLASPRATIRRTLRTASTTAHTRKKTKNSPVANTWKPEPIIKTLKPKLSTHKKKVQFPNLKSERR